MKLKQRKENLYAFNLGSYNSSKNKKKHDFSFKTITGNFYEDLINSDLRIKRNKKELSLLKNKTIKESIYSNRQIPKSWKTMLGYTDEVYKAIDRDPNFAYYLGSSNKKENKVNEFFGTKLKNINHINNENKNNNEKNKKFISLDNIDKYIKDNNINDNKDEVSEKNEEIKIYNKTISYNEKNNDPKVMHHQWGLHNNIDNKLNDKFLSSKLDEYRTKYDIDKFMGNVKHRIKEIKIDDEDETFTPIIMKNKNINYYREFLKDKTQNNRESVLKKTIYSNLIPEKDEKKFFKTFNDNKTIETYKFKKRRKYTPYKTMSYFGNKEDNLNNDMINKKIKRDLELINFFGPHYYNCYVCKKRNMDFYANSSPKQTMILLNYLKKVKLNGNQDKYSKRNNE